MHGGRDRFEEIDAASLFDDDSPDGDLLDETPNHVGVDRVGRVDDLGLLCVPDLTWSGAAGHLDPQPARPGRDLRAPVEAGGRGRLRRRFVALLDAPSRLSRRDLPRWRSEFDCDYAAAYHPWLAVPGDDPDRRAVSVPPSAVAAGVIAARESRLGLPWGPANEVAAGVVTADDVVTDAVHDELHLAGINVFRAERDGFRLTAARTLSSDASYRQLSVRRLMTMIALIVERKAQWLVFEPNTAELRAALFHTLTQFLRDLFRRGLCRRHRAVLVLRALRRPAQPGVLTGAGRLVAEIGVAPSRPLEYLVLRISQDTDGGTSVPPLVPAGAARPPKWAVAMPTDLVQTFRFAVTLTASPGARAAAPAALGNGLFAECSGLDLEADVKEYLEGGRNDGVVRRVGRAKLSRSSSSGACSSAATAPPTPRCGTGSPP